MNIKSINNLHTFVDLLDTEEGIREDTYRLLLGVFLEAVDEAGKDFLGRIDQWTEGTDEGIYLQTADAEYFRKELDKEADQAFLQIDEDRCYCDPNEGHDCA